MKRIVEHREKCVGCLTCTSACMIAHDDSDNRSRISLDSEGDYKMTFCKHCDLPECAFVCPTGAMHKEKDGLVLYEKDQCAVCFMCIMACPYGVLKVGDREKDKRKIMKCDMCKEANGGNPQCVSNCPMGALTIENV